MDSVIRPLVLYVMLLVLFRITGKRSIGQISTFDFVLLLIIGETTQQALVGNDFSITTAVVVVVTLLTVEVGVSALKARSGRLDRLIDGVPLIILDDGRPLRERMRRERVGEDDILEAAREAHGIDRLDQIRRAVLERNGEISIIPRAKAGA